MKIISMATPSHKQLEDEWFRPSIRDDVPVDVLHCDDAGPGKGIFRSAEFDIAITRKTAFIADAVAKNQGGMIVWADVDIQFFQPVAAELERQLQGYDMVFQRGNHLKEEVCSGFFATRCTAKTLIFFRALYWATRLRPFKGDQYHTNFLLGLSHNRLINRCMHYLFRIKWHYLPDSFYCPGVNYSRIWNPGDALPLPDELYLHHANWTVGIDHKIAQFQYVRDALATGKPGRQAQKNV